MNFAEPVAAEIEIFALEADQLWSFVEKRTNKRWVWLVLKRRTQQISALDIGKRWQASAMIRMLVRRLDPDFSNSF